VVRLPGPVALDQTIADLVVGDALDYDLAWYASQELAFLIELL
jgi:hypothetical protein